MVNWIWSARCYGKDTEKLSGTIIGCLKEMKAFASSGIGTEEYMRPILARCWTQFQARIRPPQANNRCRMMMAGWGLVENEFCSRKLSPFLIALDTRK